MVKLNVGTYTSPMDPMGKLKTYKRLDTLNLFFLKSLYNYLKSLDLNNQTKL